MATQSTITRYICEFTNSTGWRLNVTGNAGELTFIRYFSDKYYGSKEASLAAAQQAQAELPK